MTLKEAQDIAERFANFHSRKVTKEEIKMALVKFANFYEDIRFLIEGEKGDGNERRKD